MLWHLGNFTTKNEWPDYKTQTSEWSVENKDWTTDDTDRMFYDIIKKNYTEDFGPEAKRTNADEDRDLFDHNGRTRDFRIIFKFIENQNQHSTKIEIMDKDLEHNTEFRIKWPQGDARKSCPQIQEQFMLIEDLYKSVDRLQKLSGRWHA